MQVSVENLSSVERRLTIVVPADEVKEAVDKRIENYVRNASIKGFRPGKAPKSFVEKQFGADATREAMNEIIEKSFYQAITEQKLFPINTPRIEPKLNNDDKKFEFTASFEVMPEIKDIKLSLDQIEKLSVDVTDEDVTRVIEQLRKQFSKWEVVSRTAQLGDRVVINYQGVMDGKLDEKNQVQGYPLELGTKSMIPGFEEGIVGMQVNEEKTISLQFPEDYHNKDYAGKESDFIIKLTQVLKSEIPELNEEFVKTLGVKSGILDDLKTQICSSLETERDRLVNEQIKEQVFKALLDQNPIDVPSTLISREAHKLHDELHGGHEHHHSEDEMNVFDDMAKKRVSLGLLIVEYAKANKITAEESRVKKRIEEIASAYEDRDEVVAWLSSEKQRANIEAQVAEDQVLEKLLEGVKQIDKKISYSELKGIRI